MMGVRACLVCGVVLRAVLRLAGDWLCLVMPLWLRQTAAGPAEWVAVPRGPLHTALREALGGPGTWDLQFLCSSPPCGAQWACARLLFMGVCWCMSWQLAAGGGLAGTGDE